MNEINVRLLGDQINISLLKLLIFFARITTNIERNDSFQQNNLHRQLNIYLTPGSNPYIYLILPYIFLSKLTLNRTIFFQIF